MSTDGSQQVEQPKRRGNPNWVKGVPRKQNSPGGGAAASDAPLPPPVVEDSFEAELAAGRLVEPVEVAPVDRVPLRRPEPVAKVIGPVGGGCDLIARGRPVFMPQYSWRTLTHLQAEMRTAMSELVGTPRNFVKASLDLIVAEVLGRHGGYPPRGAMSRLMASAMKPVPGVPERCEAKADRMLLLLDFIEAHGRE